MNELGPLANILIVVGVLGTLILIARWTAGRQVRRIDHNAEAIRKIRDEDIFNINKELAEQDKNIEVLQATVVNNKELEKKLDKLKSDMNRDLDKVRAAVEKTNSNVADTREDLRAEFKGEHSETRSHSDANTNSVRKDVKELRDWLMTLDLSRNGNGTV